MSLTGPPDVSGRYEGVRGRFAIELRVDVDGTRSTRRVSADYHRDGEYYGSMRIDAPSITSDDVSVTITGTASFTWTTRFTKVRVAIARAARGQSPLPAEVSHFATSGAPGSAFTCAFVSERFRTVVLEEAIQHGVTTFDSYDTGALPSAGERRTLSYVRAFEEAGIELVRPAAPTRIDARAAGSDATWNDAELHAAMQQHFSRVGDEPRWAIWMLHATRHDTPGLLGLMFDRRGLQRQGCVVFHGPMQGSSPDRVRRQLHTCVHELGHGFNLLHCWQKSLAEPPVPSRPAAASWMNYPRYFPGGEPAYWPRFAFQFDDLEVAHLRHAFRQNVIPGGAPFLGGAASKIGPDPDEARGKPPLRLTLVAPATFGLGVPVTVRTVLSAVSPSGQLVPAALGPRAATVDFLIHKPGGEEILFEPLLHHCRGEKTFVLHTGDAPVVDDSFIYYGKHGFPFDRPGVYPTRARYTAADGQEIFSNVVNIRVLAPATPADRAVADLVGSDDVGTLLSVTGSRARELRGANSALQDVIDRFPRHEFADVARIVRGASLVREFKTIAPDGTVLVQSPDRAEAEWLVDPLLDAEARPGARRAERPPGPAPGRRRRRVGARLRPQQADGDRAGRALVPHDGHLDGSGPARRDEGRPIHVRRDDALGVTEVLRTPGSRPREARA